MSVVVERVKAPSRKKSIDIMFDDRCVETYKGKWGNLYFSSCGKSSLGKKIFDSESEALARIKYVESFLNENSLNVLELPNPPLRLTKRGPTTELGKSLEYSHAFAIPIKERD